MARRLTETSCIKCSAKSGRIKPLLNPAPDNRGTFITGTLSAPRGEDSNLGHRDQPDQQWSTTPSEVSERRSAPRRHEDETGALTEDGHQVNGDPSTQNPDDPDGVPPQRDRTPAEVEVTSTTSESALNPPRTQASDLSWTLPYPAPGYSGYRKGVPDPPVLHSLGSSLAASGPRHLGHVTSKPDLVLNGISRDLEVSETSAFSRIGSRPAGPFSGPDAILESTRSSILDYRHEDFLRLSALRSGIHPSYSRGLDKERTQDTEYLRVLGYPVPLPPTRVDPWLSLSGLHPPLLHPHPYLPHHLPKSPVDPLTFPRVHCENYFKMASLPLPGGNWTRFLDPYMSFSDPFLTASRLEFDHLARSRLSADTTTRGRASRRDTPEVTRLAAKTRTTDLPFDTTPRKPEIDLRQTPEKPELSLSAPTSEEHHVKAAGSTNQESPEDLSRKSRALTRQSQTEAGGDDTSSRSRPNGRSSDPDPGSGHSRSEESPLQTTGVVPSTSGSVLSTSGSASSTSGATSGVAPSTPSRRRNPSALTPEFLSPATESRLHEVTSPPGLRRVTSPPGLRRVTSPPGLRRVTSPPGLRRVFSGEGHQGRDPSCPQPRENDITKRCICFLRKIV